MNPPSEDIKDILLSNSSLGLVFNDNLYVGKEPTKPRDCMTIFDSGVFGQNLGLTEYGYERQSVQIRVRNMDYLTGWAVVQGIKNYLHGGTFEINGTVYTVIYCSSGPALLDWDDNGNVRFVVNFDMQRRLI